LAETACHSCARIFPANGSQGCEASSFGSAMLC
jgi:hypothetical protein